MTNVSDFSGGVDQYITNLPTRRTTFNAGQAGTENDFLNRFKGTLAGQETLPAMYQRLGDELGIPGLQKNVNTLTTTMNNLPSTYGAATTGYDVNANQLSRIIGQKSSELAPALSAATTGLSSAQGLLGTEMGLYQSQQNKDLLPYQYEKDIIAERQAREMTGFTQDNEAELNTLIMKMNQGITLSEGEANRANALAVAEKNYQASLKPIALAKGNILVNPTSGEKISSNLGWG